MERKESATKKLISWY